jgi:hypothetical protein
MKERPILFSGEMVRAILDGRKTMTRRVAKDFPVWANTENYNAELLKGCPYGVSRDRLWVRETWAFNMFDIQLVDAFEIKYLADSHIKRFPCGGRLTFDKYCDPKKLYRNRPSIFMPRWASRITIEIIDIRVEKLQDISEEDAKAEGVTPPYPTASHKVEFQNLWNTINAKRGYSWDTNPWVWVIEFKVI